MQGNQHDSKQRATVPQLPLDNIKADEETSPWKTGVLRKAAP